MSIDYEEDNFPDAFDEQHENVQETNPYLLMSPDDFRMHMVKLLENAFNNEHALKEAMEASFTLMEKRLQELEWKLQGFQKKLYGDAN